MSARKQLCKSLLLIGAILVLASCDRGYRFEPVGWTQSSTGGWIFQNQDLRIEFSTLRGLVYSRTLVPEPEVTNVGSELLTVLPPKLVTAGSIYESTFGEEEGRPTPARRLQPEEIASIPIFFRFPKTFKDSLAEPLTLVIDYRVGSGETKSLRVQLRRG